MVEEDCGRSGPVVGVGVEEWRVGGRGDVRAGREGSWEVNQPNQGEFS